MSDSLRHLLGYGILGTTAAGIVAWFFVARWLKRRRIDGNSGY